MIKRILFTIILTLTYLTNVVYAVDRDYDWYYTQHDTGKYSDINCGAAITTMAIKWVNKDYDKTVEDVRNTYKEYGGEWTIEDVTNCLNDNNINTYTEDFPINKESMTELLDESIIILCIDFGKLNYSNASNTGHYIILKDYYYKKNNLYLIVNDPYLGEDRNYKYEKIIEAVGAWWNCGIVVESKNDEEN